MKRCAHPPELEAAVERVRACFPTSTDLLSKQYRKAQRATASEGFCSVASEAVWQDAQRYGYKGRNASWYAPSGERLSHWWLVSPDDCILDPTADQFSPKQLREVYAAGKPGGFPGIRRPEGVPVVGSKARKLRERAGLGAQQTTFTEYLNRPLPRTFAEEDAASAAYSLRRKVALAREAYEQASAESGDLRDPRVVEKARRYQDLEARAGLAQWAARRFEDERAGTVEAARAFDLRPSDTVLDYATTAYPSKRGEEMGLRCPVFNIRVRSSDADVVAYAIRNDNTVMGKARAEKYDRYLSVVWSSLLEGGKELYQSSRKTNFRGCGVGPRLYEALAAHACRNDLTMTSDRTLSSDSRAFWERQEEKGRAKYDKDAKRFVVLDACGIRSTGMRGLTIKSKRKSRRKSR